MNRVEMKGLANVSRSHKQTAATGTLQQVTTDRIDSPVAVGCIGNYAAA